MRELKFITEEQRKEFKLTDDVILQYGAMLNTKTFLHVEELHFTDNGSLHTTVFPWKNLETGKTEMYSYLAMMTRPFTNPDGVQTVKLQKTGLPENKIVFSIKADDLIERYGKLLKKIK